MVESVLARSQDEPVIMRRVVVEPSDVVYLKGLVEASRGLATLLADAGGELVLLTSAEREAELDELLADLSEEIGLRRRSVPGEL
jgi:hypothetical protein